MVFASFGRQRRYDWEDLRQEKAGNLVYTERELRAALLRVREDGDSASIRIAQSFAVTSPLEIDSGFPSVHIYGTGNVTLYLTGGSYIFGLAADEISISNLTFRGEDNSSVASKAISIRHTEDGYHCQIDGCVFYADTAISLDGAGTLFDSQITRNRIVGGSASSYPISLSGANGVLVSSNSFGSVRNQNAIKLYDSFACVVSGNQMGLGEIHIDGATSSGTSRTTIAGNTYFSKIEEKNNGGTKNAIVGNTGSAAAIITNLGGGYNTVIGNTDVSTVTTAGTDSAANNT